MHRLRFLLVWFACLLAPAAAAAPVVVEAVQYPAWLERNGASVPLVPGTELRGKDRLRTGENARARLRFSDGSTVKLGENANFQIEQVRGGNFVRATLRVAEGAFRYATDKLRLTTRRDVTIRARSITLGIRGTDVWGKSTDERSLVCLIEGAISVGAQGHPTLTLDQPLDFYEVKGEAAPSVQKVDPQQLAQWARETETSDDAPVGVAGGAWRVIAATPDSRDAALALARMLRVRGYPARATGEAPGPYPVVIAGLAGEFEALALIRNIRTLPGITDPRMGR